MQICEQFWLEALVLIISYRVGLFIDLSCIGANVPDSLSQHVAIVRNLKLAAMTSNVNYLIDLPG